MRTGVTDLTTLDPTAVTEREQLLIEMLNERFPDLDFSQGGVLEQLLALPDAVLDVLNRTEIENLKNSMSIKTIQENPSLADPTTVDALLSNYFIVRESATSTSGVMAIVIDALITTSVPATTQFTVNGRTFVPDQTYMGVANSALVVDDSTRLITQRPDGNYWFTVNVIESVTGGTTVVQGVPFAVSPEPDNFVQAYAAIDFSAGAAAESNASLIAQAANGLSVKVMADRSSIASLLKDQFPAINDISIIGYGDMEMSRDRANIFGIGHGSKADVYVRTAITPLVQRMTVMASLSAVRYNSVYGLGTGLGATVYDVGSQTASALYEFNVPPTVCPGFYRADRITPWDPTSQTTIYYSFIEPVDRGIYYPAGQDFVPVINTAAEARYSPYQGSASFRMVDAGSQEQHIAYVTSVLATLSGASVSFYKDGTLVTETQAEILADLATGRRLYDVYLVYAPMLSDIQTYMSSRDRQVPAADYMLKGAIPCIVGGSITVGYKAGTSQPDVPTLQSAIAAAINAVPFTSADLQVSVVVDAVTATLGASGYTLLPATLTGELLLPDGTTQNLTTTSALTIPTLSDLNVSRRIVAYYASPEDINITLQPVSSWSV